MLFSQGLEKDTTTQYFCEHISVFDRLLEAAQEKPETIELSHDKFITFITASVREACIPFRHWNQSLCFIRTLTL